MARRGIPAVRYWRARALNSGGVELGRVTVLAPTRKLAGWEARDALIVKLGAATWSVDVARVVLSNAPHPIVD